MSSGVLSDSPLSFGMVMLRKSIGQRWLSPSVRCSWKPPLHQSSRAHPSRSGLALRDSRQDGQISQRPVAFAFDAARLHTYAVKQQVALLRTQRPPSALRASAADQSLQSEAAHLVIVARRSGAWPRASAHMRIPVPKPWRAFWFLCTVQACVLCSVGTRRALGLPAARPTPRRPHGNDPMAIRVQPANRHRHHDSGRDGNTDGCMDTKTREAVGQWYSMRAATATGPLWSRSAGRCSPPAGLVHARCPRCRSLAQAHPAASV